MDSDHRTLWIDIPFISALGYNPPNLHCPEIRPVRAKDLRSCERFASEAKTLMNKADSSLLDNLKQLKQMRYTKPPLHSVIAALAALVAENNEIRQTAAAKAR